MNEFEIKTFIANNGEIEILNIFETTYKMNPQFNDLLIFWKYGGLVFSSFTSLSSYADCDFDKKTKVLLEKIKYQNDNFDKLIFKNTSVYSSSHRDFLATTFINFLTSLNDIGSYEFNELEYRREISHLSNKWVKNNPDSLIAYCEMLKFYNVDNSTDLSKKIKEIKTKKLVL